MRAEVISIGDELTTGQRLDTNSQWLAERLLEIGVPVAFHTTVGDQLADNVLVFRQACERADIVHRCVAHTSRVESKPIRNRFGNETEVGV